ncbi:MAG: hypothetical protein ABI353_17550 [Isosphaeraceae bacterium]
MNRVVLLALLLIPGPAFAIDQVGRDGDVKGLPEPVVAPSLSDRINEVNAVEAAPAPWARPSGGDEASAWFRQGIGKRLRQVIRPSGRKGPRLSPTWRDRPGLTVIEGELSATVERAEQSAFQKLGDAVSAWVAPEVARTWKVPTATLRTLAGNEREIIEVHKDYGTLYQAVLRCELSPSRRAEIVRTYESQVVARRLGVLGVILAFVMACLAALAAYIRADEATKGYYTNRLRLIAAAGVGAAGVVAYRVLSRGLFS